MKQYLVTYLGEMDDVPCRIFHVREDAEALARGIDLVMRSLGDEHHPVVANALDLMGRDVGTYVGVAVATFEDGEMVAWDLVVDSDGGDDGE